MHWFCFLLIIRFVIGICTYFTKRRREWHNLLYFLHYWFVESFQVLLLQTSTCFITTTSYFTNHHNKFWSNLNLSEKTRSCESSLINFWRKHGFPVCTANRQSNLKQFKSDSVFCLLQTKWESVSGTQGKERVRTKKTSEEKKWPRLLGLWQDLPPNSLRSTRSVPTIPPKTSLKGGH